MAPLDSLRPPSDVAVERPEMALVSGSLLTLAGTILSALDLPGVAVSALLGFCLLIYGTARADRSMVQTVGAWTGAAFVGSLVLGVGAEAVLGGSGPFGVVVDLAIAPAVAAIFVALVLFPVAVLRRIGSDAGSSSASPETRRRPQSAPPRRRPDDRPAFRDVDRRYTDPEHLADAYRDDRDPIETAPDATGPAATATASDARESPDSPGPASESGGSASDDAGSVGRTDGETADSTGTAADTEVRDERVWDPES